jgi:phytoene dehydrogenase-like protein
LPAADVTMFDLAPEAVAGILGDRLPRRISRAYRRFRQGPGAFKVDFAVEGGVPWTNPLARRAGTVHVVGDYAQLAATERDIHAGRMPERPFVLVGQQYLADPQRSVGNVHPVWTYAHVPNGFSGDATEAIITQIERFAPGFRDRIIGKTVRTTTQMSEYNPNYVGGDIMTGSKDIRSPDHVVALHDRRPRDVHLLGGHPAGTGRSRHVRRQRRAGRTRATKPVKFKYVTRQRSSHDHRNRSLVRPVQSHRGAPRTAGHDPRVDRAQHRAARRGLR